MTQQDARDTQQGAHDMHVKSRGLMRLYPKDSRTRSHGGGRVCIRISLHPDTFRTMVNLLKGNREFYHRSAFIGLAIELLAHAFSKSENNSLLAERLRSVYNGEELWLVSQLENLAHEIEHQVYQGRTG